MFWLIDFFWTLRANGINGQKKSKYGLSGNRLLKSKIKIWENEKSQWEMQNQNS
jgi:hypothetical protein